MGRLEENCLITGKIGLALWSYLVPCQMMWEFTAERAVDQDATCGWGSGTGGETRSL